MNDDEDYPGQTDEIRRASIILAAVEAADRVLMHRSNGSVEEINYLTARVAEEFMKKALIPFNTNLLKSDLANRILRGK